MVSIRPIEVWRKFWRDGIAPQISNRGLEALRKALKRDDPGLIQGATTDPPPLEFVSHEPVTAACVVSFPGWQDGLHSVQQVEDHFWRICHGATERASNPDACRVFLNWWDTAKRAEAFPALLEEVDRELELRQRETPKAA